MIRRMKSQQTGLMKLKSPTPKQSNLQIGMRMLHMKSLTRKLRNPMIGSRMSLFQFQIRRLRSHKIGMTKKMVIGSLPLFRILNVMISPDAANGNSPPRRTPSIKENGARISSITRLIKVFGALGRSPTQTTTKTRLQPTLNQLEL